MAVTTVPMRKLQVLILDDEPIVGKRLKSLLTKIGCDVETFNKPEEACRRICEKEFDLVISDIIMGGMDGTQVLECVREHSALTKVIMITGYASMDMARSAMENGAFEFIAKPFQPEELRLVVRRAAEELGIALQPDRQEATGAK
jgi:DNA-binding NtrC family response regulator